MNELITIGQSAINNQEVNTVNARDLHSFLESKQDFSTWIKNRIDHYGFVEKHDFVTLHKKVERAILIEYHLSLDMAKELSMVERNEKGKEARLYFLKCERMAKKVVQRPQVQIPTNFKESVQQLLLQIESNEQLTAQIESDRPKVELANAISASTKAIKIGAFAKVISNQSGFVIGEKNLFKWLRFEQIINNSNVPFQRYVDNGWFEMKQGTYEHKNTNGPQVYFTTMITGMGQTSIFKLFRKSQHSSRFLNKSARANRNGGYALFSKEATA